MKVIVRLRVLVRGVWEQGEGGGALFAGFRGVEVAVARGWCGREVSLRVVDGGIEGFLGKLRP
jgi:hypothetical protein